MKMDSNNHYQNPKGPQVPEEEETQSLTDEPMDSSNEKWRNLGSYFSIPTVLIRNLGVDFGARGKTFKAHSWETVFKGVLFSRLTLHPSMHG